MEPRYEHDCDNCKFVTQIGGYDVYLCVRNWTAEYPRYENWVCRHGNDGPEYLSGNGEFFADFLRRITIDYDVVGEGIENSWSED